MDTDASSLQKTQILGDEYDEALRGRLREVLLTAGAKIIESKWGMAGSQDILTVEVDVDGQQLIVESETYIGLSITGPGSLVDWVVAEMAEKPR